MFGEKLRCPVCNKYTPDRCTCNKSESKEPAIEFGSDEHFEEMDYDLGNWFDNNRD